MIRSYKYKLYNNSKANAELAQSIERYSEVYNYCVALYNRYYRLYKKTINKYDLQKHLTKIKGRYKTEWNELGSQAIQDITDRLDRAYKLFFANIKKGVRAAPPTFKCRGKYKSFTLKQAGYKIDQNNDEIKISKNKYKYFNSRVFDGTVKTLTVKRNHKGELFVIICVEQAMMPKVGFETGKSAGFDFGLTTFLVDNEGEKYDSPMYLKQSIDELSELQRKLSKKKKGSNNRKKAKTQLVSCYEKIVAQRDDFQWKLAVELVRHHDILCFETLDFLQMQKDKNLKTKKQKKNRARKILDLSPSSFMEKVKYKAAEYNKEIVFIDKWFPSTKVCSSCGHVEKEIPQEVREWVCPFCGSQHDRDTNAAKNILQVGTSACGTGIVRLEREFEQILF